MPSILHSAKAVHDLSVFAASCRFLTDTAKQFLNDGVYSAALKLSL